MDPILQATTIAFLKAAIESSIMQQKVVADGRTKMTPEEEARLRELTDIEAARARELGNQL